MPKSNLLECRNDIFCPSGPMLKLHCTQRIEIIFPFYNDFRISQNHDIPNVLFLGKIEQPRKSQELDLCVCSFSNPHPQYIRYIISYSDYHTCPAKAILLCVIEKTNDSKLFLPRNVTSSNDLLLLMKAICM